VEPPDDRPGDRRRPFPESLCHGCAAPPRYVTTDRGAVFIRCPILDRYPPQPVRSCEHFRPKYGGAAE
jgi:hypothetical protein